MRVRPYREGDEKGIRDLFKTVFDRDMPPRLWKWKYVDHGLGTMAYVVEDKRRIVAHYGAVPRRCVFFGKMVVSAVISDVMVHPAYRGVFKKEGVFSRLARRFILDLLPAEGPRKIHFGYGFPMRRHRLIAVRLGLYEEVEKPAELTFHPARKPLFYSITELFEPDVAVVDRLWADMRESLAGKIVNVRDSRYLKWRVSMPSATFGCFLVERFGPRSIMVFRTDTQPPKLYEYVGALNEFRNSLLTALWLLGDVQVRVPPFIYDLIGDLGHTVIDQDYRLVANRLTGPYAEDVRDRFFYTYGEEDV